MIDLLNVQAHDPTIVLPDTAGWGLSEVSMHPVKRHGRNGFDYSYRVTGLQSDVVVAIFNARNRDYREVPIAPPKEHLKREVQIAYNSDDRVLHVFGTLYSSTKPDAPAKADLEAWVRGPVFEKVKEVILSPYRQGITLQTERRTKRVIEHHTEKVRDAARAAVGYAAKRAEIDKLEAALKAEVEAQRQVIFEAAKAEITEHCTEWGLPVADIAFEVEKRSGLPERSFFAK